MPTIFDRIGPFTEEEELEKEKALKLAGAATATLAIPAATMLPFQDYLNDTYKIKEQEAMRMFPQADPSILKGDAGKRVVNLIPENQRVAQARLYNVARFNNNPNLVTDDIYKINKVYPGFLDARPGLPSTELGSYQETIKNKSLLPEETLEALTVTPGPNPGRFAKDYVEILADKLGKTINQLQADESFSPTGSFVDEEAAFKKIKNLTSKIPGTAGYVWGNLYGPQYSYAEGNRSLGQKETGSNPALYVSQIDADPLKEADYLYTSNILKGGEKDPRVKFKHYPDLGPGTGPSYGVAENKDISFRKDLISARGELTTGDLQALLAERNLPFAYQTVKTKNNNYTGTERPGNILRENLERLAKAENITEAQAIKQFARYIPSVGDPSTPSTLAVTGRKSEFPSDTEAINPFGKFASKTDLRQIGILPPSDKASYKAFNVGSIDDFNAQKQVDNLNQNSRVPYGARSFKPLDTYSTSIEPGDIFNDAGSDVNELFISRNRLRPLAANKLLNRTVGNLIKQAEPIKGLGLGGLATGGIATAMDPAVIDALSRGDYMQAGTTAALNTTIASVVGGATAKGLQALQALGYARPAAAIASSLPLAGGVLSGLALGETGKAINRAYKQNTGKDWADRNKPKDYDLYTGPTPTIQSRTGTAILGGRPVQVPYGSIAGQKTVGRPWWDKAGSQIEKFANLLNSGSVIGR